MYKQEDLALVDGMNKQRLREACKAAEIKNYSKMTVEKMRETLRHHIGRALVAHAPAQMETAFTGEKRDTTLLADVFPAPTTRKAKEKPAPRPEREVRNGIKRPLDPKSKCGQVWAWLDAHPKATSKELREHASKVGWNLNNASIEFSQWRRFNGLTKEAKAA